MRRVLPSLVLASLSLAFAPAPLPRHQGRGPSPSVADAQRLQGQWTLVGASSGILVPRSAPVGFTLTGTSCRMEGPGVRNPWTVTLRAETSPKEMDLLAEGHLIRAVYTLEGDTLTVCFDSSLPDSRPASVSAKGDSVRTWVFRRGRP